MLKILCMVFVLLLMLGLPTQSFSQTITGYDLKGIGYSIGSQITQDAAIQLSLGPSKIRLQEGHLQLGDTVYDVQTLTMSFSMDDRIIRISAALDDSASLKGDGRLMFSNQHGDIYQISGVFVKDKITQKLVFYAVLKQTQQKSIAPLPQQEETTQPPQAANKDDVLLLVVHTDRVTWRDNYRFTIKTYDPKTNLLSNFYQNWGYLEGVEINATIKDPLGNTIKTFSGKTQKFGYYEGSHLIPDNARLGNYKLSVTVTDERFEPASKELIFFVNPIIFDNSKSP